MIEDVLFIYTRQTQNEKLLRVVKPLDVKVFEDDPDWVHIGTIEPRAFIECLLQDNPVILAGCFRYAANDK